MSYEEATRILQETYQREQEHKQKVLDRRRRRGEIIEGEQLTHAEKNARMMAFLWVVPSLSLLCHANTVSERISQRIQTSKTTATTTMRTKTRMEKMRTADPRGLMRTIRTTVLRVRILSSQTTMTYPLSSASTKHGFPGPFPEKSRLRQ